MSRNFIPCLGLVLGAVMIAGTPALASGTVTEVVIHQSGAQDASADLAERVEKALAANKSLAAADIDVKVEGTRVILEGQVSNAAQRQAAERLVKRVKGVKTVDNQIALRLAGAPAREGTKGSVLAGDVKDSTEVATEKTGDALDKTGSAIGKAASATKDAVITGAEKTRDAVTGVPEKIDETWITSKIAGKINADDALEQVDVDVKVNKNVVTITGDVPSAALRDRVLRIARETEGVASVVDQMTVRPRSQD